MTDTKLLIDTIRNAGCSITFLAKKIGISREALHKKINNETEFKASEICCLKSLLHMSNTDRDRIFFKEKVE